MAIVIGGAIVPPHGPAFAQRHLGFMHLLAGGTFCRFVFIAQRRTDCTARIH